MALSCPVLFVQYTIIKHIIHRVIHTRPAGQSVIIRDSLIMTRLKRAVDNPLYTYNKHARNVTNQHCWLAQAKGALKTTTLDADARYSTL